MNLKKLLNLCIFLMCFILPVRLISAQEISVEAQVSANKVAVGSAIRLSLNVTGTQNVAPIDLPHLDGFESRFMGPSTQISIINGQMSSSVSFAYTLLALKVGQYTIPALNIEIDGQMYKTEPINIEVVDSSASLGRGQGISGQSQQPVNLKDKLFVVLKTAKNEIYLGEPLPIKIMFFVSKVNARDVQYPSLDKLGFNMTDFDKPKQYQQLIGGVPFQIVEFDATIFPIRTGELKIGPVKIECNVLVRNSQNSSMGSSSGMDDFFGDEFFNKFFDQYERMPITLESADVSLNVLPLPEEGKPNDFQGAVGKFSFEVSAAPTNVKVGDPITLKMNIAGEGDLSSVKFPDISGWGSDFKVYDPQIKQEENQKLLEQVVIPKSDQVKEIPAVSFSYFDVDLKKYVALTKGPFPITVEKSDQKEDFKVVNFEKGNQPDLSQQEDLGKDILFIKDDLTLKPKGLSIYKNPWFILMMFVYVVLWSVLYLRYKDIQKLNTDQAYARRLRAPKEAQKGLQEARNFLKLGKKLDFYNAIYEVIQVYFANKLHLSSGVISFQKISEQLHLRKIDQGDIEDLRQVMEECELIRYASAKIHEDNMKESLRIIEKVIDYLEKKLK